jgi:hypothetical protein
MSFAGKEMELDSIIISEIIHPTRTSILCGNKGKTKLNKQTKEKCNESTKWTTKDVEGKRNGRRK